MNARVSRRHILRTGAAGATLVLGFGLYQMRPASAEASSAGLALFAPNAFIRIDSEDRISLVIDKCEVGQGVYTSLSMLLAEELDVGLDQVAIEPAPPDEQLYADPILHLQATGNSTSVRSSWMELRRAGAAARQMLIAAAAAEWRVDPSRCRTERASVLDNGTQRRLGYGSLAATAAQQPVPQNPRLKQPEQFKLIGKSPLRVDLPGKVDGTAQYGIDVRLPGMLFATVASSPTFGGKLDSLDDSPTRSIKGVHHVVTIRAQEFDVGGYKLHLDDAVAVVAENTWAAQQGLAALEPAWDRGPNQHLGMDDIVHALEAASERGGLVARHEGDVDKALSTAATRLEARNYMPFLAHAAMEPLSCVADVRGDNCEIWTATQVQARAQEIAAQLAGLPPEKVTVHNLFSGGAFGRRLELDGVALAVAISKQVGAPVKLVFTREQDIRHDLYRPFYHDRLRAGLDANGKLLAWHHRIVGSSIFARWAPQAMRSDGLDPDAVDGAIQMPYAFPNLLVEYVREEPPAIPTAFWRGVGDTHNAWVIESFVDEIAAVAKQDPIQFRRGLLSHAPRALAVINLAAEKSRWDKILPPRSGRGIALAYVFDTYLATVVEVTLSDAGLVTLQRVVCAVDCGSIVHPDTAIAQIEGGTLFGLSAALWNEVTLRNGRVEQSNFNDYRTIRIDETPEVEVHLVPSRETPGGLGETGTVAAAPALTNAIFAASGYRVRQLPIIKSIEGLKRRA
ncbi:xanthine dehydrogenase family protein molybdopterin-binding subunit [Bradyrhizobium rifense]|uniref:Xanthine dehydrogenase family protein molybdopterin-binding subunit n=2 Tax=Bradyrhizobium rifense TaxID=515499 RepID=A0A5D3KP56_9BRAD|nr:xanthine dehydrogenase family protein molybdopterin-binding subunit [Bradyrhizobium rifense]